MALSPQNQTTPPIEETFVADRAMFWNSFTGFAKWAAIAIAVLLVGIYVLFG